MILTHDKILRLIKKGKLIVDPYDESAVGPASIDLTLASQLRVFTKKREIIDGEVDYKSVTTLIDIDPVKGFVLKPGELVMGITVERVTLPTDVAAWINSRSRFARIGLMSHITAPFIMPGVSNKQVLEIYNAGPKSIRLKAGMKICQLVFQECRGDAMYTGVFKDQEL